MNDRNRSRDGDKGRDAFDGKAHVDSAGRSADTVLLDDVAVDPEVADAAAEAVRREWLRRRWTRRRDVDFDERL